MAIERLKTEADHLTIPFPEAGEVNEHFYERVGEWVDSLAANCPSKEYEPLVSISDDIFGISQVAKKAGDTYTEAQISQIKQLVGKFHAEAAKIKSSEARKNIPRRRLQEIDKAYVERLLDESPDLALEQLERARVAKNKLIKQAGYDHYITASKNIEGLRAVDVDMTYIRKRIQKIKHGENIDANKKEILERFEKLQTDYKKFSESRQEAMVAKKSGQKAPVENASNNTEADTGKANKAEAVDSNNLGPANINIGAINIGKEHSEATVEVGPDGKVKIKTKERTVEGMPQMHQHPGFPGVQYVMYPMGVMPVTPAVPGASPVGMPPMPGQPTPLYVPAPGGYYQFVPGTPPVPGATDPTAPGATDPAAAASTEPTASGATEPGDPTSTTPGEGDPDPVTPANPQEALNKLRADRDRAYRGIEAQANALKESIDSLFKAKDATEKTDDRTFKVNALAGITNTQKIEAVDRNTDVLAMGDVHGNYDIYIKNLQALGLVDTAGAWAGVDSKLVLHGDILGDRGDTSREIMLHIDGLRTQAAAAGGSLEVLAGNHDDFAVAFLTDTAIAGAGSTIPADQFDQVVNQGGQAAGVYEFLDYVEADQREELKQSYADGKLSSNKILEAVRSDPEGRKVLEGMCAMKLVTKIDDTLFVHTDLTEAMAVKLVGTDDIDTLNNTYQAGLRHLLLGEDDMPDDYEELKNLFLDTNNRVYPTEDTASLLQDKHNINRVVHGHSTRDPETIGGLQFISADQGAGKGGKNMDRRSALVIEKETGMVGIASPENQAKDISDDLGNVLGGAEIAIEAKKVVTNARSAFITATSESDGEITEDTLKTALQEWLDFKEKSTDLIAKQKAAIEKAQGENAQIVTLDDEFVGHFEITGNTKVFLKGPENLEDSPYKEALKEWREAKQALAAEEARYFSDEQKKLVQDYRTRERKWGMGFTTKSYRNLEKEFKTGEEKFTNAKAEYAAALKAVLDARQEHAGGRLRNANRGDDNFKSGFEDHRATIGARFFGKAGDEGYRSDESVAARKEKASENPDIIKYTDSSGRDLRYKPLAFDRRSYLERQLEFNQETSPRPGLVGHMQDAFRKIPGRYRAAAGAFAITGVIAFGGVTIPMLLTSMAAGAGAGYLGTLGSHKALDFIRLSWRRKKAESLRKDGSEKLDLTSALAFKKLEADLTKRHQLIEDIAKQNKDAAASIGLAAGVAAGMGTRIGLEGVGFDNWVNSGFSSSPETVTPSSPETVTPSAGDLPSGGGELPEVDRIEAPSDQAAPDLPGDAPGTETPSPSEATPAPVEPGREPRILPEGSSGRAEAIAAPSYTVEAGDNFWDIMEGQTSATQPEVMGRIDSTKEQALIDLVRDHINALPAAERGGLGFGPTADALSIGAEVDMDALNEIATRIAEEQGWIDTPVAESLAAEAPAVTQEVLQISEALGAPNPEPAVAQQIVVEATSRTDLGATLTDRITHIVERQQIFNALEFNQTNNLHYEGLAAKVAEIPLNSLQTDGSMASYRVALEQQGVNLQNFKTETVSNLIRLVAATENIELPDNVNLQQAVEHLITKDQLSIVQNEGRSALQFINPDGSIGARIPLLKS